ncbi:unnamed protein product [Mytilus coruscus]|uniref:Uncharacterized protein n=1 Tax=Mytilus coruscus TaxID=42192 RepID=A0A6J8BUN1_MYTCO|nr:unnamed protein product [Mytilus coruscus]
MANSLWIRGPQFLLKDTTDHTENFTLQNPDVDKELRPEVVNFKTEIEFSQHLGTNRFSRFSLWKNLIKAIARLKHVAHSFAGKSSCKGWHICSDSASVNAIDEARKLVLRKVQLDTYSDEIECLTTRKPLLKSSSIASLTPFLDKENMLPATSKSYHVFVFVLISLLNFLIYGLSRIFYHTNMYVTSSSWNKFYKSHVVTSLLVN